MLGIYFAKALLRFLHNGKLSPNGTGAKFLAGRESKIHGCHLRAIGDPVILIQH